tara:strand:+ start:47 stop:229 length:183 start_codon:yes stop_codon:yes gene_type:complete
MTVIDTDQVHHMLELVGNQDGLTLVDVITGYVWVINIQLVDLVEPEDLAEVLVEPVEPEV